ncbi:MAG: hypothetical protein ACE5FD_18000 [Anaerolineae bacterium]
MPSNQKFGQSPIATPSIRAPGRLGIGLLLFLGLIAFEVFNFDTTRYALLNLMGDVSFAGLRWAAVLATAFCAIDFAGLMRIFSPAESDRPAESWYLMGAWLLGATMNALMTWWAVSLTLLNHDLGNEVLSRAQLLEAAPVFVAVLVWLTRILFIGAFAVAGDHLFADLRARPSQSQMQYRPTIGQKRPQPVRSHVMRRRPAVVPARPAHAAVASNDLPPFMAEPRFVVGNEVAEYDPVAPVEPKRERASRIRQRPPIPAARRRSTVPMQARPRR